VEASTLNANFAYFPGNPLTNQTISFEDTSTGSPNAWSWNFADGATSSQRNPAHAYTQAGNYQVTLTVSGPGGATEVVMTHIYKQGFVELEYGYAAAASFLLFVFTAATTTLYLAWRKRRSP